MTDVLAIYITLALIVLVAIAQVLYFKLVIAREGVACDEAPDTLDLDWLRESMEEWMGFETDEEPAPVGDPVLVSV